MSALPHLMHRLRRAVHLHFLVGRRTQLQQAIDTLQQCIAGDQALVADMQRELAVIDARFKSAQQPMPPAMARSTP